MFKRILTPLDGSESSESILAWVVPLAKKLNAEIVLMTVVDIEPVPGTVVGSGTSGPPPEPPEVMAAREIHRSESDRLFTAATRYLETMARRHVPESVGVKRRVVSGNPEDQIVAQATATEADLIAMATHRTSPITRGVLGSVADRVLRSSPVSVLLLRPGHVAGNSKAGAADPRIIKSVVVPLDVSPASESALEVGMALASAMDARLRLVTATIGLYLQGPSLGAWRGHLYTGDQLRADARDYLKPFVEEALDEGIDAEAIAVSDDPARAIIRIAREEPASMVVMASSGVSGFRRWMLGSVTDKVVRGAECPVLVVAAEERTSTGTPSDPHPGE